MIWHTPPSTPDTRFPTGPRHPLYNAGGSSPQYTDEERLFLRAIDTYKRSRRRPFPTWSEVLAIVHALGYRKVAEPTDLPRAPGQKKED